MNARMELGRIAGIPIYLDMFFVLVVVLFSSQYFTKGDATMMSAGLVIIAGLFHFRGQRSHPAEQHSGPCHGLGMEKCTRAAPPPLKGPRSKTGMAVPEEKLPPCAIA